MKLFLSKKTCCSDDTLEALRQQYLTFLRTRNFEKKTIALYDYAFRSFIEGTGVTDVSGLRKLQTSQIQSLLVFSVRTTLSEQPRNCFPDYTADPVLSVCSRLYPYGFFGNDTDSRI